ncbi:hypothetical protein KDD17_14445 [Sulfitobacter albidus]|uniref:Uncharacterized protein n=1 Tax=Sulfitobacter albidus TaxID=2829501 RepID=A0A975JD13_9RHOB|nr:hypothetical protein [Sulfitobacter albidus]QUJ76107.1 hypothetical protein KDD17_14445 [Sulfitobacter albidus]
MADDIGGGAGRGKITGQSEGVGVRRSSLQKPGLLVLLVVSFFDPGCHEGNVVL